MKRHRPGTNTVVLCKRTEPFCKGTCHAVQLNLQFQAQDVRKMQRCQGGDLAGPATKVNKRSAVALLKRMPWMPTKSVPYCSSIAGRERYASAGTLGDPHLASIGPVPAIKLAKDPVESSP